MQFLYGTSETHKAELMVPLRATDIAPFRSLSKSSWQKTLALVQEAKK